tara:strand:+ start:17065 stop:18396 length:1332 start_codon:yes stop_codon:yes gene_type:complete
VRTITLQLFNQGQWRDAAEISFVANEMSSNVTLGYLPEYINEVTQYDVIDCWACTVNAPVSIIPAEYANWPALLDDLLPVGKARDWWLKHLDMSRNGEFEQNYALLTHACMAPVGNLRIKEAANRLQVDSKTRFSIQQVIELQHDFLEYANEHGAAAGGATGAGGVAPKLLLMVEADKVFIDADFAGKKLNATPYLTKFARNQRTPRDNQILRAEGVFYKVLSEILIGSGIETIDASRLKILEHEGQVSLWLPRFDVVIENSFASRLGMESIYSIINAGPGSYQNHFIVMDKVWQRIKNTTQMTAADFAKQYVARDLLNVVFGNSDNHGRNISFLKTDGDIRFAPIYDFAPMKAAPEIVTRLFKWENGCEQGGVVRFDKVAKELEHFCPSVELMAFLNTLAQPSLRVPQLLQSYQCPPEILDFPSIGFFDIANKLTLLGICHD